MKREEVGMTVGESMERQQRQLLKEKMNRGMKNKRQGISEKGEEPRIARTGSMK